MKSTGSSFVINGSWITEINTNKTKPSSHSSAETQISLAQPSSMETITSENNKKPHAVFVPYPLQSHISAMLKLAKLLHHNGFHITFVNTEFNHNRLIKSKGLASLSGLPDFTFASIPDGLPPSNPDASQDILALTKSITTNFLAPFLDLIASLNSGSVGRVTCIVSDGFMMKFTVAAAKELRIQIALFYTIAASAYVAIRHYRTLKDKGLAPFKDESYLTNEAYLNQVINWIPGMEGISLRYFPSLMRTADQNDFMFHFCIETTHSDPKDALIIFHTIEALEEQVLQDFSSYHSHIHTIGPLDLLLNQIPQDPLKAVEGSLWKEDTECLQWLDGHEPNSVIYVNFGSVTVMTKEQMVEFGWGLSNSKHPFLWIIRPDLVMGDLGVLPVEFVEETRGRGMVVSWCPQEKVLNHPSVGGFLTHCGWNSTVESICAGVPMLCWPFFADQQTNCWLCCEKWGIGMEIDSDVKRHGLEKLVRELMEGEKGRELKKNVMELGRKAFEAISLGGSSTVSLDKLVKKLSEPRG